MYKIKKTKNIVKIWFFWFSKSASENKRSPSKQASEPYLLGMPVRPLSADQSVKPKDDSTADSQSNTIENIVATAVEMCNG